MSPSRILLNSTGKAYAGTVASVLKRASQKMRDGESPPPGLQNIICALHVLLQSLVHVEHRTEVLGASVAHIM